VNNLAHRMTNQLELDMRAFARDLYNANLAFVFKVPEEMQQTPVDFFGWRRDGRAIVIECKQVKRRSLPIGAGTNGLQPHQWNALELAHRCGAVSMLLWRNGEETLALPFSAVLEATADRKSIPWAAPAGGWREAILAALGG
jgi:penicillin-binding protein-related factor A (putative recombinase)